MLDEEMDHIIREAAENHHPPYNDKAWDKMALQLDKHLPQKKDRKRMIFFLLFFLLLGAGTFFVLNNRYANDRNITAEKNNESKKLLNADATPTDPSTQKTQSSTSQLPVSGSTGENINNPLPVASATDDKTRTNNTNPVQQNKVAKSKYDFTNDLTNVNDAIRTNRKGSPIPKLKPLTEEKKNKNDFTNVLTNADDLNKGSGELSVNRKQKTGNKSKTKIKVSAANPSEEIQTDEGPAVKGKSIRGKTDSKLKVNVAVPGTENDENDSQALVSTPGQDKKPEEAAVKTNQETIKKSPEPAADKKLTATNDKSASKPDKKKPGNKSVSNFGLTVSIGPDISFIKLNNTGRTTLTYGAGLSYDFAKRFTARAGFYVSKKIYQATPEQYHDIIYPNLTSIDASCKIFEIPVSLSYNFGQRNKHNWFGSVGLSSFIMKKEDYVYNYKTAGGQTYAYNNSISNKNKHYFSVLNLSAGYKYQFSNRLSLQAEPYVQVPLGGVGLGKIKLNSAGVLFTLTYKPFKKKK